ncbi:FKBP-type peptidyl-prolyl cis-trans isomerase [Candidatus Saccharibacteria bacterium]|nr:FKBP-type peptidyl-prolyl cis-trans isomerase [Candidatus Saccharibacteria bacterium]
MREEELKTSPKQRIIISLIAILMLGSMIAGYAVIIMNGGSKSATSETSETISEEKILEYKEAYDAKLKEFQDATKSQYETLLAYKSEVKAYNETAANSGVSSRDLKKGSGRELGEGDKDYFAYYIGFCADESVFDSSFDDFENPSGFSAYGMLNLTEMSLIEGWYAGMVGAKVGGVREITIPGELAYGDSTEICGGYNKPLRFIVLTEAVNEKLAALSSEVQLAAQKYEYAVYYGVDYDNL